MTSSAFAAELNRPRPFRRDPPNTGINPHNLRGSLAILCVHERASSSAVSCKLLWLCSHKCSKWQHRTLPPCEHWVRNYGATSTHRELPDVSVRLSAVCVQRSPKRPKCCSRAAGAAAMVSSPATYVRPPAAVGYSDKRFLTKANQPFMSITFHFHFNLHADVYDPDYAFYLDGSLLYLRRILECKTRQTAIVAQS